PTISLILCFRPLKSVGISAGHEHRPMSTSNLRHTHLHQGAAPHLRQAARHQISPYFTNVRELR
ncbi:hypothetical protein, partial [Streptomyces sp. NPDC004592]